MEQLWMLQWELSRAGKGVDTSHHVFCGHTYSSEERMREWGEQKLCAPLKILLTLFTVQLRKLTDRCSYRVNVQDR